MSNQFASFMASLGPVGWWRLGETSGTTATDSGGSINGTYINTPTLGRTGAVANDTNNAAQFKVSGSEYLSIPDNKVYSLARCNDNFNRTTSFPSTTWGTMDSGFGWVAEVSTQSVYSCVDLVPGEGYATIDQSGSGGTWQQGVNSMTQLNSDIQIRCSWNVAATGSGPLKPVALVARRTDNNNFYQAQLREDVGGSLKLKIFKTVAGTTTELGTKTVGTYTVNDAWYVRFQLDGNTLQAKAWKDGTGIWQSLDWDVSVTDTSITTSNGGFSVRSSNSDSTARPIVTFSFFRIQTVGWSIHTWVKANTVSFTGDTADKYIHFLNKYENDNYEWAFRIYSNNAPTNPGGVSFYAFNLSGGLGPGAGVILGAPIPNQPNWPGFPRDEWVQLTATLDPGDALDKEAAVTLYINGEKAAGGGIPGSLYDGGGTWQYFPKNGTAPIRAALQDSATDYYFDGEFDEIAIFARKLTATEVKDLYLAAISTP